jgi:hypothetical protein
MPRPIRLLAPFVALLASACLNDAPLAPRPTALALRVSLQTTHAGERLHARVFFFLPQTETDSTLFSGDFAVAGGVQQVPVAFDVAPCLAASASTRGSPCTVFVELQLLDNGIVADERTAGPIAVQPGETVESPPIFLVSGSNPPQFSANGDTAVAVDVDLVRYRAPVVDPDGDLLDVTSRVIDMSDALVGVTTSTFPLPQASFGGALYATMQAFASPRQLEMYVDDTKGNFVGPTYVDVAFVGQAAPFADAVLSDTTRDSLRVSFNVSSFAAPPDSVELVVRNVVDSAATQDTLYFVCGGSFTGGNGTHTVSCPRLVPFTRARVTVVPFDAQGNWGSASTCALPGDCTATERRQRE